MRTERLYKASKRRRQVFLKKLAIIFSCDVMRGLGITMGSNLTGSNQVSAHDKDIVERKIL